jgi:hypothetical protein
MGALTQSENEERAVLLLLLFGHEKWHFNDTLLLGDKSLLWSIVINTREKTNPLLWNFGFYFLRRSQVCRGGLTFTNKRRVRHLDYVFEFFLRIIVLNWYVPTGATSMGRPCTLCKRYRYWTLKPRESATSRSSANWRSFTDTSQ